MTFCAKPPTGEGDLSLSAGDMNAARGYIEDGLRIRRLLADADPTSARKQRDVWVSCWRIADLLERGSRAAEALTLW